MRRMFLLALILAPVLAASCAHRSDEITDRYARAYLPGAEGETDQPYSPVFLMQSDEAVHDRIGSPAAKSLGPGGTWIGIDVADPAAYVRRQPFITQRGRYTNYVYRIHFTEVPRGHLTEGRNVGLFVVITLDDRGAPVLVTTFHTCGCYLAFFPTRLTPEGALPKGWPKKRQKVHGEALPSVLEFPTPFDPRDRVILTLRSETHRVMNVEVGDPANLRYAWRVTDLPLRPMADLYRLPIAGGTTSFFHRDGPRKGLVRGATKPLERLLMSWWALDRYVGEDRDLGPAAETGAPFYTSLKPWAREESNPFFFERFLKYWGWRL